MDDITRHRTNPRRGRAVEFNGVLYVGGQTADDEAQDIRGQTGETLAKIDAVLALAGIDRSRLLPAQVWLKDIAADFSGFNAIWDEWIDPEHAPTRATAQCAMATPDTLVEIVVTAALKP